MPIVIGAALLAAYFMFGKSASAAPPPAPGPSPPSPLPTPVGGGGTSDKILQTSGGFMTTRQAQIMLKSLGPQASDAAMSSLVIDGAYGPATAKAINQWESITDPSWQQDGILDGPTAQVLANQYNSFIASGGTPAT